MLKLNCLTIALLMASLWAGGACAQVSVYPLIVNRDPQSLAETTAFLSTADQPCGSVVREEVYEGIPTPEGGMEATRTRVICSNGSEYGMVFMVDGHASIAQWRSLNTLFAQRGPTVRLEPLATSWPNAAVLTQSELASGIEQSKEVLDQSLRDYSSARFADVHAVKIFRQIGGYAVGQPTLGFCGKVNSKNGFGAYGGWTVFYVVPGRPASFGTLNGDSLGALMTLRTCGTPAPARWNETDYASALQSPG